MASYVHNALKGPVKRYFPSFSIFNSFENKAIEFVAFHSNNDFYGQLQLAPPPITEEDARKGIMSLIERGLIPPAAQLTLDPSPVRNRIAPLHEPEVRHKPPQTG